MQLSRVEFLLVIITKSCGIMISLFSPSLPQQLFFKRVISPKKILKRLKITCFMSCQSASIYKDY
jgi:hypothetical protein